MDVGIFQEMRVVRGDSLLQKWGAKVGGGLVAVKLVPGVPSRAGQGAPV